MLELKDSLRAWGTPEFDAVLKRELAQQATQLPLQQALAHGSHVADEPVTIILNSMADTGREIRVTAGVFYSSIIAGCSCADDPTPDSELVEFCELLLEIDKSSAVTAITLLER